MESEADMSLDLDDDWKELEAEIKTGCSRDRLLNICRGRPLPSQFRNFVWQQCLEVHGLQDPFINFDGVYDLPEQSAIRIDCHNLVDKLANVEEERLSVKSDLESTLTLFCKSKNVRYSSERGWSAILKPLIAARLVRVDLFNVFSAIIDNFIAREKPNVQSQFHLFRLLLLYHDPELCRFLDTKKISPETFASGWFSTLFASYCQIEVTLNIWDIYFQLSNPFFVHFLALVIIINARDQILCMESNSKEDIAEKLSSFPSALEPEDIEDFCSLAHYYISKTPKSFSQLHHSCIYGPYLEEQKDELEKAAKCLENALCLEVSVEEIIGPLIQPKHEMKHPEPMKFFVVDCRPAYQFKVGHLRNSYHLNSHLMLQNPKEFNSKVESLLGSSNLRSLKDHEDLVSCSNNILVNGGEHICFVGEGSAGCGDDNDGHMNMVVAHFLQKHTQYVTICKGGYKAIHGTLKNSMSNLLIGHNAKSCDYCNPGDRRKYVDVEEPQNAGLSVPEAFLMEKFGKFSSAFKSTSAILKDKVITYIKNEQPPSETHVSSSDKVGRRYRNMASVFTIGDDDDDAAYEDPCHFLSSEEETKEMVNIDNWVKKFADPHSVYECNEILPDSLRPSLLCLNENHLVILRKVPNESGKAWLQNKRSLCSILKITSKKRQPQLITIKYGAGSYIPPNRPGTSAMARSSRREDRVTECTDSKLNGDDGRANRFNESSKSGQNGDGSDGQTNDKSKEKNQSTISGSLNDSIAQEHVMEGSVTVTAIDRFLIPRAGEATRDIKAHIMKIVDMLEF